VFSLLKSRFSAGARRLSEALKGEVTLDESRVEALLSELELSLIEADVALEVVEELKRKLKPALVGRRYRDGEEAARAVKEALRSSVKELFVDEDLIARVKAGKRPFVIVFVGVNGSGKTTTIAKVARKLEKAGLTTVIAAADTYRAGAIEQAERHGANINVKVIRHARGADSAAVAFDAIEHARARNKDVVLVDTAGRMETNVNLMEELRKVVRVSKPDLVLFVGDALTGNAAVEQLKTFNEYTELDGAILTKADADAKGGSAISVAHVLRKPVYYLGTGQGYDDLLEFRSDWFVDEILPP